MSRYYLNDQNEFVIEDYNQAKPFSSFLPAIAGLNGKPLWLYYVNRGQCIATFGVNNKDCAIMEFQPANKAYRQTALQGFRTFLKIKDPETGKTVFHEPFQNNYHDLDKNITQKMYITSYDVRLEEINHDLGIRTEVMFCTLPGEKLASLVRSLRITNLTEKDLEIEVADGIPAIIPYYLTNIDIKEMSNLRQAWMSVENYKTIPFYRIPALPYDTPETLFIEGGNFFIDISFENDTVNHAGYIVEPQALFGYKNDFAYPAEFIKDQFRIPDEQVTVGTTPCGFGYRRITLGRNKAHTSYTLAGSAGSYEKLTDFAAKLNETYILSKIEENRLLIESLKNPVFTRSGSKEFDLYAGQSFLDNFLRGGYPVKVGKNKHTFYVYSRKHGDLEREYNFFQVDSTYYSQGNSNFRDVNQNRRNDVCFFPSIGDANIKTFFNLIQLDGFNPLVLKGSRFSVDDAKALDSVLDEYVEPEYREEVKRYVDKAFTPGALLEYLEYKKVALKKGNNDELLNEILSISVKEDLADFQEGYWVDHWLYNTDLLERYLSIFPDKAEDILINDSTYTYYDNYEVVAPRDKKYVLTDNGVRQFHALIKVDEKERMIKERKAHPFNVRTQKGKGEVYFCNLLSKIIVLLLNKIASLDPEGVGIEMEANKPGWCDALNGLPGILGSSINESAAVKRLALLVKETILRNRFDANIRLPEEALRFFNEISGLLISDIEPFEYWDKSYTAKEAYREETIFGLSGKEGEIDIGTVLSFLDNVVKKVDKGLEKAFNKQDGVYYTYFINEVTEYELLKDGNGNELKDGYGYPFVKPLKFRQRPIPYFLEGPVHVLRTEKDINKARSLYESIRKTGLYDEKLKMYKVNDNIMHETKEIGRQNIFPRGWLENEAVFLHMEYKYFLELLRSGLYDEFFQCIREALIPFLDPSIYGRSILENSSFIASTVHPDSKIHGTGFVSRLTGASAEFLSMWLIMTCGKKPFIMNENNELCLKLSPAIPEWLFTKEPSKTTIYREMKTYEVELPADTFAFNFLGRILTVYHNPGRKNTFGDNKAETERIEIHENGKVTTITGNTIPMPYAEKIRDGLVDRLDVYLA